MDIDKVRELIQLMVDNELAELDISDGENKIKLKRGPSGEVTMVNPVAMAPAALVPVAAASAEAPAPAEDLIEIKSPMVGTFYAASSPDSPPLVAAGDRVTPDDAICIIEAMKVMNEIKAECSGVIVEVCVTNAQPIEYGQVLFRVRAS